MPPPLTDDQISAALDGEAGPSVQDHLARCPACQACLDEARRIEGALHTLLHRFDCPASQQLGEYLLGRLDADGQRVIARHLEGCARCVDELGVLRDFLADTPLPPAPQPERARPRRLGLAELVAQFLPPAPALALRGAGATPLMATAGDTTIFLDMQPTPDGRLAVTGQVVADDQERWEGALVEVRQEGEVRAAAPLDEIGGFHCGPLPAGPLELRITPRSGPTVLLQSVRMDR